MTFQTFNELGYLEQPYLEEAYAVSTAWALGGMQFEGVINAQEAFGTQFEGLIVDRQVAFGSQFEAFIEDFTAEFGIQFEGQILDLLQVSGFQFDGLIQDREDSIGLQFEGQIVDSVDPFGFQFEGFINEYLNSTGFQFDLRIDDLEDPKGLQFDGFIEESLNHYGAQFEGFIDDDLSPIGSQFDSNIEGIGEEFGFQFEGLVEDFLDSYGAQFEGEIDNQPYSIGFQWQGIIQDFSSVAGYQFEASVEEIPNVVGQEWHQNYFKHILQPAYSLDSYLTGPYLAYKMHAVGGFQFFSEILDSQASYGAQFEGNILEKQDIFGAQFEGNITDTENSYGMQFEGLIEDLEAAVGVQWEGFIEDLERVTGMEFEAIVKDFERAYGMQFEAQTLQGVGFQFLVALYNVTNLRVMADFPSRGAETGSGNNAWGNPIATGQNWTSNSVMAGDFDPSNLNTDFTEEVWRSNNQLTNVRLDCDTEIDQGVRTDTLAILNHNLTQGASVIFVGSNQPDFSSVGFQQSLEVTPRNIYYIAPTLPLDQFKYWRLELSDSSNADGYLEIGTIIFGASRVFQGECFVDEIEFQEVDFADTVNTEAFTNVSNSRSQQRRLMLEFRFLDYLKGNFSILKDIFTTQRTVQKVLWIPTPDASDQRVTDRFTVFAKLTNIPTERHNNKGKTADYVSFTVELDESR